MKTNQLLFFLLLLLLSACNSTEQPPNVLVLLVDDAGYADFGFMGSEDLETPNLDALAADGMIFTDAHVSATVCAPSRAGLLTGKYQQRFGFECNALSHFQGIDTAEATIAEVLQAASYRTGAFGKWHVGDAPEARPHRRGFDYSWTFLSGTRHYFPNEVEDQEGHLKSIRENDQFTTFEGYLTDVLAEKAVDPADKNYDGVSLLPYFTGEKTDNPHQQLFWRKEGMAAARNGAHKMIRVKELGYRLYDLDQDLGETQDLSKLDSKRLQDMQQELRDWESGLIDPRWVESAEWNEVTWWIHHDLFHNQEVRASSPAALKALGLHQAQKKSL